MVHSGAVDHLVVNHRRCQRGQCEAPVIEALETGFEGEMSYRVLARAYRSSTFDEVVGQDAVATTLKNAILGGRVHHGYLFTGTRGVGKTSMARILAKALNCLAFDDATATPCLECDSCKAVAEGEDVDVVEIDAASNTGVDNIRELRSNATLRPARARFKIYIIDEVHMLSSGAFNALLKTLEEPPSHVKFILATTESHKVPATIQSRCQRFDFRAIDVDAITSHLERITESEKIEAEDGVLRRVARLANGSMRDALSILDKLLSYDAKRLTREVTDEVIPPPHDELSLAIIDRVSENDAGGALKALDDALQTGRTVEQFCTHLIEHLRTLMILNVCGPETDLIDVSSSMRETLVEQSARFDGPTFVYMITLLEELRRSVKSSGAARALADAAVVRLAMSTSFSDINTLIEQIDQQAPGALDADDQPALPAKKKEPETGRVLASAKASAAAIAPPVSQETSTSNVSPSPAQWQEASRDPLVTRVKDAVDGTLMDIKQRATVRPELPNPDRDPDSIDTDASSSR